MKKLFYISFVALILLFVFSCKKETTSPNAVPVISFGSFTISDANNAVLAFNFSDANGNQNIGLQPGDTTGNFAPGTVGYSDFYMQFYYKNYAGNFVPYYFVNQGQPPNTLIDSNIFAYRIPYMNVNIKTHALSGQIIIPIYQYKPQPPYPPIHGTNWADSLSHFRYEFWIYDRAGHKSNVVTTPEFDVSY